jgi:hypothetical protein
MPSGAPLQVEQLLICLQSLPNGIKVEGLQAQEQASTARDCGGVL